MAMTAAVKDELSRVTVNKPSARRAEIATVLAFRRCAAPRSAATS